VSLSRHKKEELYSSKLDRCLLSILLQHHTPGRQVLNNSVKNMAVIHPAYVQSKLHNEKKHKSVLFTKYDYETEWIRHFNTQGEMRNA
jgi:hypothetical protein